MVIIKDATLNDFANFKLHPKNIEEIRATTNTELDMCMAILHDISSDKKIVIYNNKPICIMGLIKNQLWLFFNEQVKNLPLSFFKESIKYVNWLLDKYKYIHGDIYYKNTFAFEWAKFLKFKINDLDKEYINGEFYRFERGEKLCAEHKH